MSVDTHQGRVLESLLETMIKPFIQEVSPLYLCLFLCYSVPYDIQVRESGTSQSLEARATQAITFFFETLSTLQYHPVIAEFLFNVFKFTNIRSEQMLWTSLTIGKQWRAPEVRASMFVLSHCSTVLCFLVSIGLLPSDSAPSRANGPIGITAHC